MEKRNDFFTQLPTHVLDALCRTRIRGEARMVFDVIIRKTYGWPQQHADGTWHPKKEDWIALCQFEELTGLPANAICRAVNHLLKMKIILKKEKKGKPFYLVQEKTACWEPLAKKRRGHKKDNDESPKSETTISKKGDTIDNDTKETLTKDREGGADAPTPLQEAKDFFGNEETRQRYADEIIALGGDRVFVEDQIRQFFEYWMARNKSGMSCRWEDEKFFELRFRIKSWFRRSKEGFGKGGGFKAHTVVSV